MKKYISFAFLTLFVNLLMASVSLEIQNVDTDAGTLDIYMTNDEEVGGFQFKLIGITITGASAPDGFMVSTSSTTILAFSLTGAIIPPGSGILTQVTFTDFEGNDICFGEDTGSSGGTAISDGSGNYIAANWGDCFQVDDCEYDECGVCNGDGSSCGGDITDGCDLPDSETTGYLHLLDDGSVLYKTLYDIGGFQFNVEGATLNDASGGDAGGAGFIISTNTGSGLVLGFSLTGATIPAGCGTLVELDLSGEATGLINLIFSNSNAQAIYFEYYEGGDDTVSGCTDDTACNYNPDATEDDGSCVQPEENYDCDGNCTANIDCNGDCAGTAVVDECDVCGGGGSDDQGCGCFEPGPSGCDEACGSTLENDECGVCGGDGSDNQGCGCFEPGPSGCDEACGSDLDFDACGVCDGDSSCLGCTDDGSQEGSPNPGMAACNYDESATIDNGSCNYPLDNFNCDGECLLGDGLCQDCFGIINGTGEIDDCEVCIDCSLYSFENSCYDHPAWNQSCADCVDELNGNAFVDACGSCVAGTTGISACLLDCDGLGPVDPNWAGVGSYDNCDECDSNFDNDCEIDCNGDWGGTALIDNCGHCYKNMINNSIFINAVKITNFLSCRTGCCQIAIE